MHIIIGIGWPSFSTASDEAWSQQPGARKRLNQVLNSEGGIDVYKNPQGNVKSTTILPNGERVSVVQPPQIPSMNLGLPLQLNQRILQLPPVYLDPAQLPAPELPRWVR